RLSPYEVAYLDLLSSSRDAGHADQAVEYTRAMRRAAPRSQFAAYMQALVLRQFNRPFAAESVFRSLDRQGGELRGRQFLFLHYASNELQLGRAALGLSVAGEGGSVAGRRSAFLYFELAALAHMRRFDEMHRVFDSVWAESPERRAGVFPQSASVLYVLRHQGDSVQAAAFGTRFLAALTSRTPSEANPPRGQSDRAAVLMAMHRWVDLGALTDSMVRSGDDRVPTLEARGVALAALGRRPEAMAVAGRLEHPTRAV